MVINTINLIIYSVVLCIANAATAQDENIPLDPQVHYGKLKNGFCYYIKKNDTPARKIFIKLIVKAGYANEEPNQLQVSHVIEHLGFQRTSHFPSVTSWLNANGLVFGVDAGAATGDATTYWLQIPSGNPKLLEESIQLAKDWCHAMVLDSAGIAAERGNVFNELGNPSEEETEQFLLVKKLTNNPRQSPRKEEVIRVLKTFTNSSLIDFYNKWYQPRLQSIVIVGDIDPFALATVLAKQFSELKNTNEAALKDLMPKPSPIQNGHYIERTHLRDNEVVFDLYYKHRNFSITRKEDYRKQAIIDLYNNMMAERLKRFSFPGLIVAESRYNTSFLWGYKGIHVLANTVLVGGRDSSRSQMINGLFYFLKEQSRLEKYGFTQHEFLSARQLLLTQFDSPLTSPELSGILEEHFLYNTPAPGKNYLRNVVKPIISSISANDVLHTFKSWRKNIDPDIVISKGHAFNSLHFEKGEIRRLLDSACNETNFDNVPVITLKPVLPAVFIDSLSSHDLIYGVTEIASTDISLVSFQNGAQLLLKPLCVEGNNKISMRVFKPITPRNPSPSDYYNSIYSIKTVMPGQLTASDLREYALLQGILVEPYITSEEVGFHCEADSAGFKNMLEIVYAYLAFSRKDTSQFYNFKKSLAERLTFRQSGFDSLVLINTQALPSIPTSKELATIQFDSSYSKFIELFAGGKGFRFLISGCFESDSIISLFDNYLASFKADTHSSSITYQPKGRRENTPAYEVITYEPNGMKQINIQFLISAADTAAKSSPALNVFLGLLDRIMFKKLREEMGVMYGSNPVAGSFSNSHLQLITVSLQTFNEDLPAITSAIFAEIYKLQETMLDSLSINSAIQLEQSAMQKKFSDNLFWVQYLHDQSINDWSFDDISSWMDRLHKVSPEIIKELANKFLRYDNIVRLTFRNDRVK